MNPSAIPAPATGYTPYVPYNATGNAAIANVQSATNPTPQPQAPPQKGNWLTHLLPTLGSIAAPVIGGLLAPETGGLSLLAGLALAGGGSAAGKAAEDAIQGDQIKPTDLLTSAAEGIGGQLTGHVLGGALKAGTGIAANLADKGATNLVQGQFAKGTVDKATAQTLRNMGITDARQVADIAPLSTGSTGAISTGVKRGLTEADTGADFSNLSKTGQNLVADNQMQLNASSVPSISKTIQSALLQSVNPEDVAQVGGKGGNVVSTFQPGSLSNVLPEDAFKVTQNFESLANKAYQSAYDKMGNVNPDQLAKYNIFKGLADEARNATFGGGNPIPLSEANKAQIISELSPMKDVNPRAYNWHVNQVTNANTLQDLRPIQAPMVRTNNALNTTQKIADNGGGMSAANIIKTVAPTVGGIAGGPVGAVAGLGTSLVGTPTADRVGAGILDKLAKFGVSPKVSKAIPQTLAGASQFITHAPDSQIAPVNLNIGNNMQQAGLDPNSLNSLLLQLAVAESANPGTASAGASGINQIVPQMQNASVVQNSLQGAENAFQQAGGAQGGVLGNLAKLFGRVTGGPAGQYEQQRQQLETLLNGTSGHPGIAPGASVPDITGNNQSAQNQFQTLQQIINSRLNGGSLLNGGAALQ